MAEVIVPVPKKLSIHSGNIAENWRKFKQAWELYVIASGFENKGSKRKVALLLSIIGDDALEVFQTFEWDNADDKDKLDKVLEKFEKYCIPRSNILFETFKFSSRKQEEGETVDCYVTALRRLAVNCNFEDKERRIRDQVVLGLRDDKVRERILRESDPDLKKVLEFVRANEVAIQQAQIMAEGHLGEANKVQTTSKGARTWKKGQNRNSNQTQQTSQKSSESQRGTKCTNCNKFHPHRSCPAIGRICNKCGERDHYAVVCPPRKPAHEVTEEDEEAEDAQLVEYAFVNSLRSKGHKRKTKTFTVKATGLPIIFNIDTGASINTMSFREYVRKTGDRTGAKLTPTNIHIVTYGGKQFKAAGTVKMDLLDQSNHYVIEVVVVKIKAQPLLSLKTCEELGILKIYNCDQEQSNNVEEVMGLTREDILRKYSQVFRGLGKLPGKYRIQMKDDVKPVIHPPRKFAVSLRDELKKNLDQMERAGVIAKVKQPTDWVSSLLVKREPKKLRLCLDPKNLNEAIRREHYPLPSIEEVATRLHDVKVFSVLDAKSGFWHIELEEESSFLTTFNTPFGRYRWLRMPFGISSAPEIWQRRMHEFIEGLRGIEVIADDFLIAGRGATYEEAIRDHDANLEAFLKRAIQQNLKLNGDKMRIKLDEVTFIGHVLTRDGLKADPRKVEAITKMPDPQDVNDLKRILGMVQYLAKFLPKLSEVTEPLRRLTLADTEWKWTNIHRGAWEKVKQLVTQAPILAYFDSKKEVVIQADASQSGVGAALLQDGKPVTLTSRAMTPTEQRYAQIEKEMLAIVHACSKFDQYIYGRASVKVDTDHKPLETIFRKPIASAPKRLQRMMLFLQKYSLVVRYKRGSEMFLADTLSRAYLRGTPEDIKEVMGVSEQEVCHDLRLMSHKHYVSNTEQQWQELQLETSKDDTLQLVLKYVQNGWPESQKSIPTPAAPYFKFRDVLTAEGGILFKSNKVVVPTSLRRKYMFLMHESHIGIENTLRRAREYMYWPLMNAELKVFIGMCDVCNSMRPCQAKEPLLPLDVPDRAWKVVSTDVFQHGAKNFLVVVDHYSNFAECDRMMELSSGCVISLLKKLFARYGIPETVISDNGPQYSSREFQQFAREWKFDHLTSSPRHPQGNGKAENAVKTCKSLLKKSIASGSDYYKALLDWRNTPTVETGLSPAQKMFGRRIRSMIPVKSALLQPELHMNVQKDLGIAKQTQKKYFDRGSKDLPPLNAGDTIWMKLPGESRREKGVVLSHPAERKYVVQVRGKTYVRNRCQLIRSDTFNPDHPAACTGPAPNEPSLRRSSRERRRPNWHNDYDVTKC